MRRAIKFKTFFSLRNTKGYTIVELLVVMGIIAILLPLTFGGYNGIRKQKYIQHVADTTKAEIRGTFIDTIATKVENGGGCNNQAAKIRAVKINTDDTNAGDTPVSILSYCKNTDNILVGSEEKSIDFSSIGYKKSMKVAVTYGGSTTKYSDKYLYLIFTSPYGQYYAYYLDKSSSLLDILNNNVRWEENTITQIYSPTDSERAQFINSSNIEVYFNYEDVFGWDAANKVVISPSGSVSLK